MPNLLREAPVFQESVQTTVKTPIMMTPELVEKMLAARQDVQVVKFRTTCTDCVPNY